MIALRSLDFFGRDQGQERSSMSSISSVRLFQDENFGNDVIDSTPLGPAPNSD